MTLAGGVLGVICGVAASIVLAEHVKITGISIGVLFSVSIGIFFGIYPALRAARLEPIQALRGE